MLVTFDTAYEEGDKVYAGTFQADPLYNQLQSDPHDIAVVVLDRAVRGIAPAQLPAYEVTSEPGGHDSLYDEVRNFATGTLNATNPAWLRISMNPATGDGGTCRGDSGGPNILGTSTTIAAIMITGDAVCRATSVVYRLDTESARNFLGEFVRLP